MRYSIFILLAFLAACSSSKKITSGELALSEKYFQIYVGGTQAAGVNVVYGFSLTEGQTAVLDSVAIEGLGTFPLVQQNSGSYSATSDLGSADKFSRLNLESVILYFHQKEQRMMMKVEEVERRETVFMPSAGGGEGER